MRRRVLHSALRRYLVCVAILMALAIGRSALCDDSAAKPAEEKPTAEKADAPKHAPGHATDPTLVFKTVHIVAGQSANDEPLADASFKVRYYWKNKTYQPLYKTDEKGEVDIELPTNRSQGISLECHPKKLVPVYYYWDGRSRDIAPPAELKLQFEPAVTIGGTVKDEAGAPIAKAKIELHMTPTFSEMSNFVFTVATLTTDAQGHWQCDTAPADVQALSINVSHPDDLRDGSTGRQTNQSLLDQSAVTTLKQGLKAVGHVFDEQAQPIAGATVQFGDRFGYGNPETKTDEEGKFTLKNCNAGSSFITVIAKGFAPDMQDVVVEARADKAQSSDAPSHEGDQSGDIEFKLKPGGKIAGRVLDTAGKPLKAVWIVSDTWRSRRSLKWEVHTDADGKFESDNAPPDAMQCDILVNGYLSIRRFVIQPQAEPYEIVVHPIPTVTGKVTDAETGKPIEKFSVIPGIVWEGRQDTYWERDGAMQFTAGKYETRYSEPRPQVALMVEAEGYQPAYSEPFKLDQDTRTIDFKLSKGGPPFGGVVIDSDGHPVEGVDIAMLGAGSQISFSDGLIDRRQNRNSPHATTDKEGKFKLANMDPPYVVIATHAKAGYAEIFTDQTTDNFEVQLLPWGRIEGQLTIGDKPAADQPITYQRLRECRTCSSRCPSSR